MDKCYCFQLGMAVRFGGHMYEEVCPTLQADATGDNKPVACYNSSGDGIAGTLDASYYKGCGEVYGVEREIVCYGIQGDGSTSMQGHGCGYNEEVSFTLNAIDRHSVAYGCDLGTTRDVGVLFLEECSKTISNGTCPGHHNHVVIAYGCDLGRGESYENPIYEELSQTVHNGTCPGHHNHVVIEYE